MSSIILELQSEASNPSIPVSSLLRKAKIIAVKLNLDDLLKWVNNELEGYNLTDSGSLPEYRRIGGELKGFNPYRGWQPIILPVEVAQGFNNRGINSSIPVLESVLATGEDNNLEISLSPEVKDTIRKSIGFDIDIKHFSSKNSVAGIVESVRNAVLDWALKLEKVGILGEGVSFSKAEEDKAVDPTINYQIGTFNGVLGSVSGHASVTANQTNNVPVEAILQLLKDVKKYSSQLGLSSEKDNEFENITSDIEKELMVVPPVKAKIFPLLQSMKNILEGASGNIVAQGIISILQRITT